MRGAARFVYMAPRGLCACAGLSVGTCVVFTSRSSLEAPLPCRAVVLAVTAPQPALAVSSSELFGTQEGFSDLSLVRVGESRCSDSSTGRGAPSVLNVGMTWYSLCAWD